MVLGLECLRTTVLLYTEGLGSPAMEKKTSDKIPVSPRACILMGDKFHLFLVICFQTFNSWFTFFIMLSLFDKIGILNEIQL